MKIDFFRNIRTRLKIVLILRKIEFQKVEEFI